MIPGRQGKLNGFTAYKGFSGSTISTANPADTAAPGRPIPDQPVHRSAEPASGSCDPVFKTGGAGPGDRLSLPPGCSDGILMQRNIKM